ncbi:DUF6950 family protein [Cupriavidus taiwanensis]|uniref:DUF6950 domain-containing protein n=1 Tax=Cupriavidus taiwanensis TaxID=164546 RepID=A0A375IWJ5_9BURK|nr:hypothetical protein [Cupriavidus taiwanensis]SPR97344.1 conserved hypothetical protein [Cupriavidus taiwanensis]
MQRLEDWPTRLAEFIEARHERAFSWGDSDCCLFVCDAIEAMTGTDPGARWRGLYASEKGARRVLRDNGGVAGIATLVLGTAIPPALAGRGDVVLVETPLGDALALSLGGLIAAQGEVGIEFLELKLAKAAWKV